MTTYQPNCLGKANRENAISVMVVGDSISHGREGDWTWRYRIWEWFKEQRLAVRFVGPYKGTSPPPFRADGGYAKGVVPEFLENPNHFAWSGRQAYQAKDLIAEQVAAYQPDFCLVQLGFNDLGWLWCDPADVLASMKCLIDRARSVKPDLKFAVANIPHRTDLPGREDLPVNTDLYNDMLARQIPEWSLPESPIALVRFCENYSCGGSRSDAAYDGLHPNALGEYQLAQAFSRTLVRSFSLGRAALVIPDDIPARPLPTPTNIKTASVPRGIALKWDAVYGAYGYDIQHRFAGSYYWFFTHVECNDFDWRGLQKGLTVECRIRTSGGDWLKSPWSSIASAVAGYETAAEPIDIVQEPSLTDGDTIHVHIRHE